MFGGRGPARRAVRPQLALLLLLALLALGVAGCAGDTDPATDLQATQAVLHAHGKTTGSPATWWWEYSTSKTTVQNGGGTQICGDPPNAGRRCGPASSPDNYANLSQPVTGLSPDTTYYFRACAQDAQGVACGNVLSFRTAAAQAAGDKLLIADNLNKRLLITDFDGQVIWKWDNPTGSSSAYAGPLGVRWMPGNSILATFGTGQVGLLDVATKTWVWKTSGYNGDWFQSPYDAELLPDGNLAVATRFNEGGRVTVYNRSTGAIVWKHLLSNAHAVHFRTAAQSYNSDLPTLLVGGWGAVREIEYAPGGGQKVTWSAKTEYTHDVIALDDDRLLTTEGYYIQKIDRSGQQLWRKSTPDENRRIALDPAGGYIYSVGDGDRIEFRSTDGNLVRSWSALSDGTRLNYPYGIAVINYP